MLARGLETDPTTPATAGGGIQPTLPGLAPATAGPPECDPAPTVVSAAARFVRDPGEFAPRTGPNTANNAANSAVSSVDQPMRRPS
jgi:hypothetical protein